jgi:RimJ/RimL family protein N-acetyltransferase
VSRRSRHPLRVIETRRLTLAAATPELVAADLAGRKAFAEAIGAEVPEDWPPELYGGPVMRLAEALLQDPTEHGWSIWYLLTRKHQPARVIGICEFAGKPGPEGSVDISYSILPRYRVQGYATEAVARLVTWAFSHQPVVEVTAETLPHLQQSIRVLEKNGFKFAGRGAEQGVVRYAVHKIPGR